MCNWKRWVWPGILATAILTALAMFFNSDIIENDLTAKAGSALQAESPWASVELNGRDLTLTGVAPSEEAASAAMLTADNAYDVRVVDNQTTLPPIASPYPFKAIKNDDGVTLIGNYPSDAIRADIVAATETAMPGVEVTDEMTLARGAPTGFAALAGLGVSQLANLIDGEASLSDSNYTIKGNAADPAAYEAELARANGALPEGGSLAMAEIMAPTVSPYTWSAVKAADNTITLSGFAPSPEARERIAARAAEVNPDATVDNQIQIASGAPEGFVDAAAYSLGYLPRFTDGAVNLSDQDLNVQGRAIDADNFDNAAMLGGEVPAGVNLAEDISLPQAPGTFEIVATRSADVVTLQGFAPSNAAKSQIADAAGALGLPVVDRLVIAAGAPDGIDWGAAAAAVVGGLKDASAGSARLTGDTASVDADLAPKTVTVETASSNFGSSMAEGVKTGEVTYRLPRVSPYTWQARHGENFTMSGYVPTKAVADKALEASAMMFPGRDIINNMTFASGEPRGLDSAISVALASVSRLEDGVADIVGSELTVTGVALTAPAKSDIKRKIENGVPPGFTGIANISVKPAPLETGGQGALTPAQCQAQLNDAAANGINFETNKAAIAESSFGVLDQLSYIALQCPDAAIEIGGHTDSGGSDEYNQNLSERRASAVANYLIVSGISSGRLTAVGYGETSPIASNDTDEGKAKNRRIEFKIAQ